MLFNSFEFIIFFPIVVAAYLILPKRIKPVWLLLSSYFFYMCWNAKYIVLILFSTLVTYITAILIDRDRPAKVRKAILACGITLNLLVLFLFKYFDFFLSNISHNRENRHGKLVQSVFFCTACRYFFLHVPSCWIRYRRVQRRC